MAKFFGTNGIRGVFPEDFNLEFIHDMTLSIGTYFEKGPILIGYDGRESSPLICKIITSTLNSIGIDCNIAGLVPTPCLEYAVKSLDYSGGIMITASHNPPQYNGIKPAGNDGVEISREDELVIENIYSKKIWKSNPEKWGTTKEENKSIETYLKGIRSHIDSKLIESKHYKIVLDLGNGAQAVTAPNFCKLVNCESILVNENIDGTFPGRGSEPTPQNLSVLSKTVIENQADFGIAFDGDGDRSIFCDNLGNILTGDKSALILIQHILNKNPNSLVVTCLNSGANTEILTEKYDSKVIRTKVGSVEVSRKMLSTNALIGFEENGGFMFGKHNQVRDGCMSLALMLDLLATTNDSLSNGISKLPPSFTTKDKIQCSSHDAKKIILSLKDEFPQSDTSDGIKITIDSKNWVMIRPSGTEPIIRIYAESESQEKLEALMIQFLQKVKSIISR
jgi:phosphomannomutase / phosphoglucomutase